MKIAIYSTKWWVWKTPISLNIALERGYALGTNEAHHVFDWFIPENQLLAIGQNDAFPELPKEIDIVFDLSGSISDTSQSIVSAIKQADVVIVPINNELKSINAGLNTIREVIPFNKNTIVVATKLQRKKWDRFKWWDEVADFVNIQTQVTQHYQTIPVTPLKLSSVFDAIFEQESAIDALMNQSGLNKYHYREVQQQFNEIYHLIDNHNILNNSNNAK